MKVIVPLAGKGTRLLPLTKRVPKPLVRVAGRPVMDYVMDAVKGLDIEELIVITGHLKESVERYILEHYDVPAKFVEQKKLDGTAGAINLARPYVDSPVLIIFVDTVFEADLTLINRVDADGIIWAKEVEDYQRFGVIVTDAGGYMTRIVEKPRAGGRRRAAPHVDRRGPGRRADLRHERRREPRVRDEGARAAAEGHRARVAGRARPRRGSALHSGPCPRCTIVPPVYIEEGVTIHDATIGPNVSIEAGSFVAESTIANSILGRNVRVVRGTVKDSLVGDDQKIEGKVIQQSVMDAGEVAPAK